MSATDLRHPVFAPLRAAEPGDGELGEHRDELLAGLTGRVVEIGAGNAMNFGHFPTAVEEVVALEPEPYLRGPGTARGTRRLRGWASFGAAWRRVEVGPAVADPVAKASRAARVESAGASRAAPALRPTACA